MAKKMNKKMGKLPKMGGKDGARPSKKGQTTALLKANKAPNMGKADKRIAKMEKSDCAV